jgi:hypothetical protein
LQSVVACETFTVKADKYVFSCHFRYPTSRDVQTVSDDPLDIRLSGNVGKAVIILTCGPWSATETPLVDWTHLRDVLSRACAQNGLTDVTVVGLDGLVPWTGCSFQDLCDSLPLITVGLANHVGAIQPGDYTPHPQRVPRPGRCPAVRPGDCSSADVTCSSHA